MICGGGEVLKEDTVDIAEGSAAHMVVCVVLEHQTCATFRIVGIVGRVEDGKEFSLG